MADSHRNVEGKDHDHCAKVETAVPTHTQTKKCSEGSPSVAATFPIKESNILGSYCASCRPVSPFVIGVKTEKAKLYYI